MTEIDPLTSEFARNNPDSFARVLCRGETDEIVAVLDGLAVNNVAAIVARLPQALVEEILASTGDTAGRWLTDAPLDEAVALLGRVPRDRALELVNGLTDRERRRKLLQYLRYPSHSVGSLLCDVRVRISAELTAVEGLKELRTLKIDKPGGIVVLGGDGRYIGVLNLWALLARDTPTGRIRDYAVNVLALHPETSLTNATKDEHWGEHSWLPVIDHENRLLGGVTRSAVFVAAQRVAGETEQKSDMFATILKETVRGLARVMHRLLVKRGAT